MTEQEFSIQCYNCNKLIVSGDESINITIMRQRIEGAGTQPLVADSLLELCTQCAPSALNRKTWELPISVALFDAVVFNKPYVLCVNTD